MPLGLRGYETGGNLNVFVSAQRLILFFSFLFDLFTFEYRTFFKARVFK